MRFVVLVVLGLGVVCAVTYALVVGTTRGWFETDVELRARAVVSSARRSLVTQWSDPKAMNELLLEIARDERIMAVAACENATLVYGRNK